MEGFASSLYQNLMEKSMKRNGKAFAYLFLAVWSMTSIGCTSSSKEERAVREIPVKTWTVSFREGVYTRSYIGEIEGESSSSLSFQVPGYVECIYVKEGQRVERGELLARLDETTLQSTYDAALSTLKQAEDAYARMEQLHKSGSLPEIKWVEVQSSLQQARSMEQIAKKNLKDVELRATYSGIIAQKSIDTGSTVLPGVPAFKLMKIDWVNVNISVPENEVADVKMGADVTVTVAALGGKSFSGKITEKGIAADPLAHTYKALARIENRQGELLPGMVCVVNMGSRNNSQIVIPNSVVQVDYNGDHFVWLCNDGVAVKQTVSVGALSGNGVIISSGLAVGDKVIVEGASKVSENMKVSEQ